ncbi:Acylphosphatase-2, putative [Pediculus humanus corporis]|uniref:Acylphosphatase n=1 Tax=Pediculus humanus subsp. corporis TaxID=121224 RepID=E0VK32_PEDHC|nr:Acylphosphatase-2, putative [Pediculus humanus corporis]EEB13738.1 Acylphosphatase-2, putative [Pediculus humanus corporis]
MASKLISVNFEIYGKVQGVFFRKFTQEQATALGLRGWCMNSTEGTVKGTIQGERKNIDEMKNWLQYKGSPYSKIEKAVFSEEKEIDEFSFNNFFVKR